MKSSRALQPYDRYGGPLISYTFSLFFVRVKAVVEFDLNGGDLFTSYRTAESEFKILFMVNIEVFPSRFNSQTFQAFLH